MSVQRKLRESDPVRSRAPLNANAETPLRKLFNGISIECVQSDGVLFDAGDVDQHSVYTLSGKVVLLDDGREEDRVSAETELARFPLAHQYPREHAGRAFGGQAVCGWTTER